MILDGLTDPFHLAFMQRAFIAATLASLVCAIVGTFVVLKGLAFMGDAIAHSSLAGMATAYALGGNILWGALAWVIPACVLITLISRRANVLLDTSIGIVYAGGFSLGIIIISRIDNYSVDLFSFLFGNVLGVSWNEIIMVSVVTGVVIGLVILLYKELLFASYDANMAVVSGVPVRFIQYLLPVLIGVTTVIALKTVGIVLVLALLVIPPATGRLLANSLPRIMATSICLAFITTVSGMYISYYLDLPPGPSIVLVASSLFIVCLTLPPSITLTRRWLSRING